MVTKQYGQNAFEFLDNFLRVTIPFSYTLEDKKENDTVNDTVNDTNGTVNGTVNFVYECIKNNNNITIEELITLSSKSRRTILRAISTLKNKNKIKRVGSDKNGFWEIV